MPRNPLQIALLAVDEFELPPNAVPIAALYGLGLAFHILQADQAFEHSLLQQYAALMLPSDQRNAQAVREHQGAQRLIRQAIQARLPIMLLAEDAWVLIAEGQLHTQKNRSWRSMGHDLAVACQQHLRRHHNTLHAHKPLRKHAHTT